MKKIIVTAVAALALTLGFGASAEAASFAWYDGGYNDVQNGSLNAQVYSNGNTVSKAKLTYDKKKGSGISVKFGFQAVNKGGGSQGPVSWSGTYKMKPKQKRTVTVSGSVALSGKRPCARGLMKDTISGKIYYTRTKFCTGL